MPTKAIDVDVDDGGNVIPAFDARDINVVNSVLKRRLLLAKSGLPPAPLNVYRQSFSVRRLQRDRPAKEIGPTDDDLNAESHYLVIDAYESQFTGLQPRLKQVGAMQKALACPVLSEELAYLIGGKVVLHDVINLSTNRTSAPLVSSLLPKQAQGWIAAIEQRLVEVRNGAGEVAA